MMDLPQSPEANAARIADAIRPHLRRVRDRQVVLVDGDRTLSPDDTSRTFAARAGIDAMGIKRRFQRDGYVFDAFRYHTALHLALGEAVLERLALEIAAEVPLYPGAMEGLRRLSSRAEVFVVSAGIPAIWRAVLQHHGLERVGVIGGIAPALPYVFGRAEKGLVARLLREAAGTVLAVGDSDVDTEMLLAADRAVLVVNHHHNADLLPHLTGHRALWQIPQGGWSHPGVPHISFEGLVHLLDPLPIEVASCR